MIPKPEHNGFFPWVIAMANGVDVRAPWWVQAIGVIGVTAAIAIYLVYWVTNTVSGQITIMGGQVSQQLNQSAAILKAVTDEPNSPALIAFRKLQLQLAVQECINTAKSPAQTHDCIVIGDTGDVHIQ